MALISGSHNNHRVVFGHLYLSPSVCADYHQPNYLPTHEDEIAKNTSVPDNTHTLLYIIQGVFNVEASITISNRQCGGGILSSGRDMTRIEAAGVSSPEKTLRNHFQTRVHFLGFSDAKHTSLR